MGQDFSDKEASWGDFTVTKSNPAGTTVRFTMADPQTLATISKQVRMILADAVDQFIAAEEADLVTNGDSAVVNNCGADVRYPGDGYDCVSWNYAGKYCEITLTALTNIAATGDITVEIPYADVV